MAIDTILNSVAPNPTSLPNTVVDQNPTSLPNTVVDQKPIETVTPVSDQYDKAVASGNPTQLLDVAKNNWGHPVSIAALSAAQTMHEGDTKFQNLTEPIIKAGGPQTEKGRIAISNAMTLHKDEPLYGEAVVQWLSGNGKYARDLLTGGKITSEVKPDLNGKLVQVYTNALGKVVRAHDIDSEVDMSAEEFQNRSVGRQTYENTINYLSNKQNAERNNKDFKDSEARANNITAATQNISDLSGRLIDSLDQIKHLDIDPKEQSKLAQFLNKSLSSANSTSTSKTLIDQATANAAEKQGKALTETEKIALKLPIKEAFSWGLDGVVGTTKDSSKSWSQLRSGTGTDSSNSELNKTFNQDRASLASYLKISGLSAEQQLHYLNAMDLSKQIAIAQNDMIGKDGKLGFLPLPNSSTSEEPYALTQAKAVQNQASAKIMSAYQEYIREYKTSHPTFTISPNELEAGFSRSPEYKKIIKEAKDITNKILSTPREFKRPVLEEPITKPVVSKVSGSKAPPVKSTGSIQDLATEHGGKK